METADEEVHCELRLNPRTGPVASQRPSLPWPLPRTRLGGPENKIALHYYYLPHIFILCRIATAEATLASAVTCSGSAIPFYIAVIILRVQSKSHRVHSTLDKGASGKGSRGRNDFARALFYY